MGNSPPPPGAASTLCLACGMCCAGTVYSLIPLAPDEEAPARKQRFSVISAADGQPCAPLPCPHLSGTACRIYDSWRPRTCSEYSCKLQHRLHEGAISLDEALASVARLQALIAERLPETATRPLRELVIASARSTRKAPLSAEEARLALEVAAVNREVDRILRHPGQGTFAP